MNSIRTVVVDDSALFRTMLRNILSGIPGCKVVASVGDGEGALRRIEELEPDLVTLDVEMPGITGITVLRELKKRGLKTRVIMVSRLTRAGAQVTLDALMEGAFDFILKPSGTNPTENKLALTTALSEIIRGFLEVELLEPEAEKPSRIVRPSAAKRVAYEAVVIGCSTGGPDALAKLLPYLSVELHVPVVVVQHMPERFTGSLAARLNESSDLEIVEAEEGLKIERGKIIIAHGGKHLKLVRKLTGEIVAQLTEDPHEHSCRPAVDYTMRSAVNAFHGPILAVILTGMGKDGVEGCRLIREHGGSVVAQHPEGCTVFGMPKAVIGAGLADQILPLSKIGEAIEAIPLISMKERDL